MVAINREQTEEVIESLKAMCFEHGDVSFMVAIKDEDGFFRYSMNINFGDAMTLIATISGESASAIEND